MKILFLGDSITEGVGASCEATRYVNLVGAMTGHEVHNYGVGGTRIARQIPVYNKTIWNYDFRLRLTIMPECADMVFIFGGTNDYGHGRLPLGTPADKSGSFCSELKLLIDELIEKYGKEKLCFMLPLHRYFEDGIACKGESGTEMGATLAQYVQTMREIIGGYGIDYIDLYENGFARPAVANGTDGYTVDGLHPNDKGCQVIADRVCEYLKSRGF